jgi:SAM-dependent methyltransferase
VEIVDTNLEEIDEFLGTLGEDELAMFDIQWREILPRALYLKGIHRNGKLVALTGVWRKWLLGFTSLRIVKKEYWNQGIGTGLVRDWISWCRKHHIPYSIRPAYTENIGSGKSFHRATNVRGSVTVDGIRYDIVLISAWALPLVPVLLGLIRLRHLLHRIPSIRFPKVKLGVKALRWASHLVDYEADHMPINGRLIEYGYVLGVLSRLTPGTALDVGCVALHNCVPAALAFAGWQVRGIDTRRDWGFHHPSFKFIQGDIRTCSLPDESFDAVTCISTLEHVGVAYYGGLENANGDIVASREIIRLLKSGGTLVVTAPYSEMYFRRPEERVYDDTRLRMLFRNLTETDRQIYTWVNDEWVEANNGRGKENMICLTYRKK